MRIGIDNYGWSTEESYNSSYIDLIILCLVDSLRPARVLDLGCGNGKLCGKLAGKCELVVGVDDDKKGVEIARQSYPGLDFYNLGVQDNPQSLIDKYPGKFDAVIYTEVIEHLFLPRQLLHFASALLRPRGYLIISTPYHGYLKNLALSLFNKWDHHHTSLEDGWHIKFWSRKTLEALLLEQNFEIVSFNGAGRLPWLWKSMIVVARSRAA